MKLILVIQVTLIVGCPNGFTPVLDGGSELCYIMQVFSSTSFSASIKTCQNYGNDTRLANFEEFQRIRVVGSANWPSGTSFYIFGLKGYIPILNMQDRNKPWYFYGQGMALVDDSLWGYPEPNNFNGQSCIRVYSQSSSEVYIDDSDCNGINSGVNSLLCVKDAKYCQHKPNDFCIFENTVYPYGLDDALKSQLRQFYQMNDFDQGLQSRFLNISSMECLANCGNDPKCQSIWYADTERQCFLTYWVDHPILVNGPVPTFSRLHHWLKT